MNDRPAVSPLHDALDRVGDRWALLLVDTLLAGPRRFNDLRQALPGLAPNVLTQRLKHLERVGVVTTKPYSQRPLRFSYQLTAAGMELAGTLRLLAQWGAGMADEAAPLAHVACGTALDARWYCPTCARVVDDAGEPELFA